MAWVQQPAGQDLPDYEFVLRLTTYNRDRRLNTMVLVEGGTSCPIKRRAMNLLTHAHTHAHAETYDSLGQGATSVGIVGGCVCE